MSENDLLGRQEVAALLELSPSALDSRRKRDPLFPLHIAELAATPVWERWQLVEYARRRSERYHEREGIERMTVAPKTIPPDCCVSRQVQREACLATTRSLRAEPLDGLRRKDRP